MILNMVGGGGGNENAMLNVRVIGGTTKPENPKENTIWVNTEHNIPNFAFATDNPYYDDIEQGTVWIRTSSRSSAPIDILKKNHVLVYPNYVYQYVGNEWVPCVANTYQNGAWIAWEVYLYYHGIEYEGITGGWDYLTTESGLDTLDYLKVMSWAAIDTSNGYSYPYTLESIDFTTYNTMEFTITQHSGSSSAGTLKVQIVDSLENSNVIKEMSITKADLDENGIYNFDISDVSRAGYIKLSVGAIYTTSGTYHTVNISEIKLK
jgi:hypothetical protein